MGRVVALIYVTARGERSVHRLPLPVVIGWAEGCDIVVQGRSVAARHLRVWSEDGVVFVEDLGSQGGTFVRGERLASPTEISGADVVDAGGFQVTAEREG